MLAGPIEEVGGSLGGVILHELSHATAATGDHVYGCGAVQGLRHDLKFTNADNYEVRRRPVLKLA